MNTNDPSGRLPWGAFVAKLVALLVCGGVGGVAGRAIAGALRWDGAFGAFVAALVAMVVALALWAAGVLALRSFGRRH